MFVLGPKRLFRAALPRRSLRTEALTRTLRVSAARVTSMPIPMARQQLERLSSLAPPSPTVRRKPKTLGGVPGEWFTPRGARDDVVLLHIHGGGYSLCSTQTHSMLIGDLTIATRARCFGVNYRLAPEHPFPAALDDCLAAYRGMLAGGVDPAKLVLTGDSAGGALVITTLLRARDLGMPMPRAVVLMSPWVDLVRAGESIVKNAAHDYLSPAVLRVFADSYLGGMDATHPLASPAYADLTGLPPMLVHSGGAEVLVSEIRRFVGRARSVGVEVDYDEWEGMVHAFHGFSLFLPEARQAFRSIGEWVGRMGRNRRASPLAVGAWAHV